MSRILIIIGIIAAIILIWVMEADNSIYLYPMSPQSISETFMGLFVIAAVMERAQEVFIKAWYDEKRLNTKLEDLPTLNIEIHRAAFFAGLVIAFLISLAGLRVLEPLMDKDSASLGGIQVFLFYVVDVVLTSFVLAGGSDGMHKLVSLVLDTIDQTREKVNKSSVANPDNRVTDTKTSG